MRCGRLNRTMKKFVKSIIKVVVLLIIFVATLFIAGKIMNKDHDNITMEMDSATFPLVTMVRGDIIYNELHGYSNKQELSCMTDNITLLGDNRETGYHIDTFGTAINKMSFEVRTTDGARLIETGEVTDFKVGIRSIDGVLKLKDLLEPDTEYALILTLTTDEERDIYFYTRVIWSDGMAFEDKMAFVQDFHDRLFDKDASLEIKKYLETNSSLNDNSTFANVDIHSNFYQVTYGELYPKQLEEPTIYLKDISETMMTVLVKFIVFTGEDDNRTYYDTTEYFRIKVGKERMLLIDYERSMDQMPKDSALCQNDKIVLGITDRNVDYSESEDGNTVAFAAGGKLYSYQSTTNKLTKVFSFLGEDDFDARILYNAHGIKILDIEESGNIEFAVFGYMASGRHEGEVGIEIYRFDSKLNTIEEMVYIPYNKSYEILDAELNSLLYLNREQHLYFTLENKVYCVDIEARTVELKNDVRNEDTLSTSVDHRILISTKLYPDSELASSLVLTNLNNETDIVIQATTGDAIKPLGFVYDDVIYGIAHMEDVHYDNTGRLFFPMYQVIICNEAGALIKCYEPEGVYVTGLEQRENQIILERVTIDANGNLHDASPDYITAEENFYETNVTDATTVVDIYETYVQLKLPKNVDTASLKIVVPKEIVYEGGRILEVEITTENRFYVYDAYGLEYIYNLASNAVELAYDKSGWVYDSEGTLVWKRINRKTRNQIMAITEDSVSEERNALAVCLDSLLKNEGIVRNSNYLLDQGQSVLEILEENMEGYLILDLKDCSLESVLYYVSEDIPVLVLTGKNDAVLITGYNDTAVVILDPQKGTLDKMPMEEAEEWFDRCGGEYISYVEK